MCSSSSDVESESFELTSRMIELMVPLRLQYGHSKLEQCLARRKHNLRTVLGWSEGRYEAKLAISPDPSRLLV